MFVMDEDQTPTRYAAKGGIERHQLERLVDAGMTIAEIAEEQTAPAATTSTRGRSACRSGGTA